MIDTITKRIKTFENISLVFASVAAAFIAAIPAVFLKAPYLVLFIGVGLILQGYLYFSYRAIGKQKDFFMKKIGPLIVAIGIAVFIIIRGNYM